VKAAPIGAGQIARQHLTCPNTLPGVELAEICTATWPPWAGNSGGTAWLLVH
jgi:hypothetical protein